MAAGGDVGVGLGGTEFTGDSPEEVTDNDPRPPLERWAASAGCVNLRSALLSIGLGGGLLVVLPVDSRRSVLGLGGTRFSRLRRCRRPALSMTRGGGGVSKYRITKRRTQSIA